MSPLRREFRALLLLAVPAVATQVGNMMLGVVDTLMVARVSVETLSAATLGNVWVFGTMMFAQGVIMGMDPIISQAHGARDGERSALALQQGLVVAAVVSVPLALAWLRTEDFLLLVGQSPELAARAHAYVQVQIPAVPFICAFIALRAYLQGRALMLPALWAMLVANVVNVIANWALIFGHLGAPALGLVGAGIATSVTRIFLPVALVGWVAWAGLHRGAWRAWDRESFALGGIGQILRLGIPVAITLSLENWAFQIATLMSGRLGDITLAGHAIVMNVIAFLFMVPLGISIGASARVGNLIGAGDAAGARRACIVSFALGGCAMFGSAAILYGLRDLLPRLYTTDLAVIAVAAWIFPVAAAFQLFDGLQVVGCGLLRGMGRTQLPVLANAIGYYALALPIAWWLAFRQGIGIVGVWWGLAVGLAVVAVLVLVWVFRAGPLRPETQGVELEYGNLGRSADANR